MSEAAPKPPDPFQALRQSYDQATEAWAKAVEQAISTEEFAASAGKVVERYTEMQEALRKTSQAVAEQLHIPTKDDIARIAQLVINVERKIDEVTDLTDALVRSSQTSDDEAITALGERFAALEGGVEALTARLDALERIEKRLEAAGAGVEGLSPRLDALERIESRLGELAQAAQTPPPAETPSGSGAAPVEGSEQPADRPPARARRTRAAAAPAQPAEEKPAAKPPPRRRSTRSSGKEE